MNDKFEGLLIVYLLLCNKLPPNLAAQNIIYYLTVSVGQEFRCGLASASVPEFSCEVAVRVSAGATSHLKAQLRENPFPNSLTWFLAGFSSIWAVGLRVSILCWLLARPPSAVPFHVGLSIGHLTTLLLAFDKGRDR